MQAVLKALRREGYDLKNKWNYHGSDPSKVRQALTGLGGDDEVKMAVEAVSIVMATNFYGTNPVKAGEFRSSKKAKFDKCASELLAKMPSRFRSIERNLGQKVTLNALVAALPELSLVSASIMDNGVLPGMLQLGIKLSIKSEIREEIEDIIGKAGTSNAQAKETAAKGQDNTFIGLAADPLLGGKVIMELADQLKEHWVAKVENNPRSPIAVIIEQVALNPYHFLDLACGETPELHRFALDVYK